MASERKIRPYQMPEELAKALRERMLLGMKLAAEQQKHMRDRYKRIWGGDDER